MCRNDARSTEDPGQSPKRTPRRVTTPHGQQVTSLRAQGFGGLSDKELRDLDERLKRIREVSADLLALPLRTVWQRFRLAMPVS